MEGFKSLDFLLKKGSKKGSKLICKSNHQSSISCNLTVVIDGQLYLVVHETATSVYDLSTGTICEFFQNGYPYQVRFSLNYGYESIRGFICFNNIPQSSPFSRCFSQQRPQMDFTVHLFEKNYIDIRFAKQSDRHAPCFALGCFKYHDLIEQFRRMVNFSREYRIPVLWKIFVYSLRKIGYFDIFDINHFQSIVLLGFLRMFSCENDYNVRNRFLSFIQQLLLNNCWFMIIGDKYRAIRGRPSRRLIELFSDSRCSPIVNFVDYEFDCVGVITPEFRCALVSLSTTEVVESGSLCYENETNKHRDYPDSIGQISDALFPCADDDFDDDNLPLLRRRPAMVYMSDVPKGVLRICGGSSILFVFKMENNINVFIQRPDGTFECLCPYFFIMLNMFAVDDRLNQLKNQFTNVSSIGPHVLVEALVCDCGFESIFDGSATTEQIREFLFESDFGVVLQLLIRDFDSFQERLLENCSIQENPFVCDLKRVFEFILGQFGKRKDLGQEIGQILSSLDRLVKFLTLVPHDIE